MNFEMLGKLTMSKETDKFKPFTETKFEKSGWVSRRLLFNAVCGDNRHSLAVNAGSFADGHGDVYVFTKPGVDENGKATKGESIKIPFKERLTSKRLPEVAEFRKFIIDLEENGRRRKLASAIDKVKNGTTLTSEELNDLGIESEDVLSAELEKSNKKRHEFISEWDFVECIKKVIESGKYKDKKFLIRGNGVYQYSEKDGKVYESLVPNRIYLADDDAEEYSTATLNFLFNNESLDEMSVDEKGKYYVNGFIMEYDNGGRKDKDGKTAKIPVPKTIVIPLASEDADEKAKKKVEVIKKKFVTDSDTYREYGIVVDMLNGAQKTAIKLEDLDEDVQEDIACGLIDLEDVIKDMGGSIYGDRIQEWRFVKPARNFSKGSQETVYTPEDMTISSAAEDESEDLFEDDDEI